MARLNELLEAVLADVPLGSGDAKRILEWRGRLMAYRHALPDDARGAQVADAVIELVGDLVGLANRSRAEIEVTLQDNFWRFARLKGEATTDAVPAAAEIQHRAAVLPDARALQIFRDVLVTIATAELRLLKEAES